MDGGFPPYTAPPFINPSVSNGTNVAWFQGDETTKLPAYDNFNFSIQRQLGGSMFAEAAYSGVMGEHLQTELLDYNQISPSYLTAFGTRGAKHGRVEQQGGLGYRQCGRNYGALRRASAERSRRRCGLFRSTT